MKKQHLKRNLNIYLTKNLILNYSFSIFLINFDKKKNLSIFHKTKYKSLTLNKLNFSNYLKNLEKKDFFVSKVMYYNCLTNLSITFEQTQKKTKVVVPFAIKLNNFFLINQKLIQLFFFKVQSILKRIKFLLVNFFVKAYFLKKSNVIYLK
jgi:hypothetical protein